jgi:hypothetical protein
MLFALRAQATTWTMYRTDEAVRIAFAASEREAFERVRAERGPGEDVWVSGAMLYAPYFAMFYFELPPREVGLEGLEPRGFHFFPPGADSARRVFAGLRPGDWMIDFDPVTGEARVLRKGE